MIKRVVDKIVHIFISIYYKNILKKCKKTGKNTYVGFGTKIDCPECIEIGDNVYINNNVWLSLSRFIYVNGKVIKNITPSLIIKEGTYIGRFSLISCIDEVFIGKDVMISDRCYVGDIIHNFKNKNLPIIKQDISSGGKIIIGDGSWLGVGSTILPNVKIGKHCIIGANSVVTKNVPDYHIVAGNPAIIIKKIEFDEK
ncbi:MAG: acyltransferase [Campylobacteraceae bacterium]|nr:acyltransferase [Campylobacteraceae bacterium]